MDGHGPVSVSALSLEPDTAERLDYERMGAGRHRVHGRSPRLELTPHGTDGLRGGASLCANGTRQSAHDHLVGHLREVVEELADGVEARRSIQADHLIRFGLDPRD